MADESKKKKRKRLIITPIIIIALLVTGGIFAYTQFLKKNTADLLDVVPANAAFVFQINDNAAFVRGIAPCKKYLNEVFSLDALAGFEYFADMSATKAEPNKPVVISGHAADQRTELLFAVKMSESIFQQIIKQLKINPKNYVTFETHKIFTATTHYHEFKITCFNGIFIAAESQSLLQQAIHQLAGRDCLRQSNDFQPLYHIITKNDKQNWLILQHENFIETQQLHVDSAHVAAWKKLTQRSRWSAYITRFSDNELILSGYSTLVAPPNTQVIQQFDETAVAVPADLIPAAAHYYVSRSQPVVYARAVATHDTLPADTITLSAPASICFGMHLDTADYSYLLVAVPDNFSADCLEPGPEMMYRNIAVYRTIIPDFVPEVSPLNHEFTTTYAVQLPDYWLFTESVAAAKSYIDEWRANRILSANQLYRFTNANLPSQKQFECYYVNANNHFSDFFTRAFLRKKPGVTALKAFAFNCQTAIDGLLPNTIYIKWDSR